MATLTAYGTNYTIASNVTPSTLLNPAKWTGDIKHISDVVVMTTAADAASLVYVGKLPKGAIPLYTVFNTDDATSTATGIIGYASDTNALGAITAITTTLTQLVEPTVWNTPLTAAKDVYVTTATAATSASTNWHVTIAYGMEG
jgi:hypothetical protein